MKVFTVRLGLIIFLISIFFQSCHVNSEKRIIIENENIRLEFDKSTGAFLALNDLENSLELINHNVVNGLPWEVNFSGSSEIKKLTPSSFSYSMPNENQLILKWKNFKELNNDLQITATISLDDKSAMSYWNINLEGLDGLEFSSVTFPKVEGLKDFGNEKLAVPEVMGELISNPREMLADLNENMKSWRYPSSRLSLQCMALYNPEKSGLYLASNDTSANIKDFSFTLDTLNTITYKVNNFHTVDPQISSYNPPYSAIIGTLKGDWITAAEIYREWGSKQSWSTNSRLTKGLVPDWVQNTALWMWNRGRSDNVLKPAAELKKSLGLPVSVWWHWWHGCSYDEGFPEYFPPREGKESFTSAVTAARNKGINSIVYMNHFQWGNSTESWKNENAILYAAKDSEGNLKTTAYNKFTGNSLTNMCIATQFWKDKYSGLCDSAVNIYNTSGVYMDQACRSRFCFDETHGHPIGGGNYWVQHFGKLTNQIRSKISKTNNSALAGEDCGETFLPYLDMMMTLQVSRERYSGVSSTETIPFFQAVYHQYGITYGSYSSLVTPPFEELWPKEHAPDFQEQPLDDVFDQQFLMEQARGFVWGMQPTIANYHEFLKSQKTEEIEFLFNIAKVRSKGMKYLLRGKFLRSPKIPENREELTISKLSIYSERRGENVSTYYKEFPTIYSGTWKSDDDCLGIALASITDQSSQIDLDFKSSEYELPDSGEIFLITKEGKKLLTTYSNGNIQINHLLMPQEVCIIEIIPSNKI